MDKLLIIEGSNGGVRTKVKMLLTKPIVKRGEDDVSLRRSSPPQLPFQKQKTSGMFLCSEITTTNGLKLPELPGKSLLIL